MARKLIYTRYQKNPAFEREDELPAIFFSLLLIEAHLGDTDFS